MGMVWYGIVYVWVGYVPAAAVPYIPYIQNTIPYTTIHTVVVFAKKYILLNDSSLKVDCIRMNAFK